MSLLLFLETESEINRQSHQWTNQWVIDNVWGSKAIMAFSNFIFFKHLFIKLYYTKINHLGPNILKIHISYICLYNIIFLHDFEKYSISRHTRLSWNGCFIGTKGYFRRIVTFVLYIICACALEMQWGFGCAAASGTNCQNDALKGDFTANTVKTG